MRKGWWGLIAAILLWGTTEPKAATAPLQAALTIPNLVAHWNLEETSGSLANDAGPNNLDGAHVGSPVISTTASPFPGSTRSLQLTQTANPRMFVQVPDAPSLGLTGSFTLAAWINVTGGDAQHGILEKFDDAGGGYFLRLGSAENLKMCLFTPTGTPQEAGMGSAIPAGWQHAAGTYDAGLQTMRVYLNGAQVAQLGPVVGTGDSTNPLIIGRDYGPNGLNGFIDEPRIYDKALSAGELTVLMNGQAPVSGLTGVPGTGSVQLTWNAPPAIADVAVTYAIYQGTSTLGPWTLLTQAHSTTSYLVTGLPPTPVFFQVVAVSVVASAPTTSTSTTPLNPQPRTNGHEEGLFGDKCACGSSVGGTGTTALWAGLVLALGAILAARRR